MNILTRQLRASVSIAIVSIVYLLAGNLVIAQEDDRAADHEELRSLRGAFAGAINKRDFEAARPLLTDSFTFTTIANRKLSGLDKMESYWDEMFEGEEAVLDSMTVAPEADELTYFISEKVGVAQGTSKDVYEFKSVGHRELTSRWTAVVEKVDGKWKVARVHMSANVLDNAVLDAASMIGDIKTVVCSVCGLLVGLLLGFILFRRKKAS